MSTSVASASFDEPLILIGASKVNWRHLKSLPEFRVVAVDGGANQLQKQNIRPQYICGDFDSIEEDVRKYWQDQNVQIVALEDQNHSDFAKALRYFDAPVIYAYGFTDGRFDHSLDALGRLAEHHEKRIYLIGDNEIAFLLPPQGEMNIKRNTQISFWSPSLSEVRSSRGLKWSLDGLGIAPTQMSISNEMSEDYLFVDYVGAPLITFLEIGAISI